MIHQYRNYLTAVPLDGYVNVMAVARRSEFAATGGGVELLCEAVFDVLERRDSDPRLW